MNSRKIANSIKNAMGTVMLLAGAFFVCSTLVSIRAVFADPIAPVETTVYMGTQSGRANARTSGRTSPRSNAATSRQTVARTAVPGGNVNTTSARNVNANAARAVSSRATTSRANATTSRNVVSRATNVTNRTSSRNVRARTAVTPSANSARVSLQGSAIRGNTSSSNTTSYSYLTNKLYTGNYSNIIDSTTGLISDDAYQNCMESYYTCMDEICTARNAAQRRCACAGRVTAFAEAEAALETANEELIKASGELALLIANKGKDVSSAFQLTDAEKVMNCVSWREASKNGSVSDSDFGDWCAEHGIFDGTCSAKKSPSYCTENTFGFNVADLDGSGSDILASLKAWADAKDNTITILKDDEEDLLSAFGGVNDIVGNLTGIGGGLAASENTVDNLAKKWGYELFAHAHNEVCSRVLDSCFNGIYEACGSPVSKCANGQSSNCPFNYNSKIEVSSSGDVELNERSVSGTNSSATCFGYTTASGDPYSSLRGPVADARRSIMNKYLLDANADCDLYGEQLRTAAQNIAYQKTAAQQALQQKRLEFQLEEQENVLTRAVAAGTNFNECISEIMDCYEQQARSNENWTEARIKTYCAQIANVPHCYEEMICNPSTAQFRAVIDLADNAQCLNDQDYTKNTCRNIVTLNEIMNGTGSASPANIPAGASGSSVAMREKCLIDSGIEEVRNWTPKGDNTERCSLSELPENALSGYKQSGDTTCTKITACATGYIVSGNRCVAASTDCSAEIENSVTATRELNVTTGKWGACQLEACQTGYEKQGNACVAMTQECSVSAALAVDENATSGTQTWVGNGWGDCVITACKSGYKVVDGKCEKNAPESAK